MTRKLKSGSYRLYSRKKNPKTGRRRNLGTLKTRAAAKKHEKAVRFFKRGWTERRLSAKHRPSSGCGAASAKWR